MGFGTLVLSSYAPLRAFGLELCNVLLELFGASVDLNVTLGGDALLLDLELVAELGFAGKRIATARNGDFVAERARTMTAIERGDRIEIVSPRHGG